MRRYAMGLGGLGVVGLAAVASASPVPLTMTSALNYDIVGTLNEVSYANTFSGNRTLNHILGQHTTTVSLYRTFTNQASVPSSAPALPDDGLITAPGGNYQISTAFEQKVGDDYVASSNVLRVIAQATNSSLLTQTATITLLPDEQKQYDDFNFLFFQARGNANGSFRTVIQVTYTDATTETVFDTGLYVSSGASSPGGTLGNAGIQGGGLLSATDTNTDVEHVLTSSSTRNTGSTGSNNAATIVDTAVSNRVNLWQMAERLDLDETKILESITFSVSASNNGRANELVIFGLNATPYTDPVPEPATLGALLMGGAALLGRRRR